MVQASSNLGDLVLDPFCGCGTTIDAAEKLGRDWIGIEVTQIAISLIKNRLLDTCGSRMKFVSGGAHATRVSGSTPSSNPPGADERSHTSRSATRASLTAREGVRELPDHNKLPETFWCPHHFRVDGGRWLPFER